QFTLKDGQTVREGDVLSIDGTTGLVYLGAIKTVEPNYAEEKDLQTLLGWADKYRRLGVWANADYPHDAERAVTFGAEGIGLCRTEHGSGGAGPPPSGGEMHRAPPKEGRGAGLDRLFPPQRADWGALPRATHNPKGGGGSPVPPRLIAPPLHEFLPSYEE